MGRIARLKLADPKAGYYHIISRTVLKSFLLEEVEKEYLLKLLKKLSQVYFVRVATFAIMSNHFHLIVQMIPEYDISGADLKKRFELYYNEGKPKRKQRRYDPRLANSLRFRLADLSNFVQDLKQRFSRWYNRLHGGHGHVWAERFKSVILEGDRALLACMVYVELNSVRAGIVDRPEEYRFSGLAHMLTGGRSAKWLDFGSLRTVLDFVQPDPEGTPSLSTKDCLKTYLDIIYGQGMVERTGQASQTEKDVEWARSTGFTGSEILSFQRRIRYFTDGVILGSQTFCAEKFQEFRTYFRTKRERTGRLMSYRYRKKRVSAPQEHLLHLFSIRSFAG